MENLLSILFCLSLFYISITPRVKSYVAVLQFQGLVLSILVILPFINNFSIFGIILPITLLVVKVILIPRYINKIILDLDIKRVIEPTIQQIVFLLLVIATMIIIFLSSSIIAQSTKLEVIPFASGFSAIAIGIYIIIFRKKLIVHVCGFLVLENGIFLFGTAVASELPVMIELGVLLDVFVVVFLMGIALNKIRSTFEGFEVTHLGRLKD
jgi:hydrogenase-4 component E